MRGVTYLDHLCKGCVENWTEFSAEIELGVVSEDISHEGHLNKVLEVNVFLVTHVVQSVDGDDTVVILLVRKSATETDG